MSFRFSLAAVLLVRREREAAAERQLAAADRALAVVRTQRDAVLGELQRMREQRATEGPQAMSGVALHERYARWAVLDAARAELEQKTAELDAARDGRRLLYVAARRDRELLDELERSQHASFKAAAAVREQKRSDDLFLSRRVRH